MSEVSVPKAELIEVMRFVAEDPALDRIDPAIDGLGQSILAIEQELPRNAYNFRYRDE